MLEDDVDTLVELLQEYRVELISAQDALSQKDSVIQSLQASLAAANSSGDSYVHELEQALLELNARTETADNELAAARQHITELEEQNERLRSQLREMKSAESVQAQQEATARVLAELQFECGELRETKRQLEGQLDEYDLVISRQQDQIVDLSEQLRLAETRLSAAAVPSPPAPLRRSNQMPSDEELHTTNLHNIDDVETRAGIREQSPVSMRAQRYSIDFSPSPTPPPPRHSTEEERGGSVWPQQRARIFEILRRSKERRQVVPIVAEQELAVHIMR